MIIQFVKRHRKFIVSPLHLRVLCTEVYGAYPFDSIQGVCDSWA